MFNFLVHNQPLRLNESVKYLGVTLDHFLNWNINTNNLCSKLSSANGVISKLRYFLPLSTLIQIYYALFFSHLNYSCQIWGQNFNHNVERMFILQKRCLRLITFSDFNAPSSKIFARLNLLKVSDLIKLRNVVLVHDILNNKCPIRVSNIFSLNHYQHGHQTRGNSNHLLTRPSFRTFIYGTNSITYKSILQWNELTTSLDPLFLSFLRLPAPDLRDRELPHFSFPHDQTKKVATSDLLSPEALRN